MSEINATSFGRQDARKSGAVGILPAPPPPHSELRRVSIAGQPGLPAKLQAFGSDQPARAGAKALRSFALLFAILVALNFVVQVNSQTASRAELERLSGDFATLNAGYVEVCPHFFSTLVASFGKLRPSFKNPRSLPELRNDFESLSNKVYRLKDDFEAQGLALNQICQPKNWRGDNVGKLREMIARARSENAALEERTTTLQAECDRLLAQIPRSSLLQWLGWMAGIAALIAFAVWSMVRQRTPVAVSRPFKQPPPQTFPDKGLPPAANELGVGILGSGPRFEQLQKFMLEVRQFMTDFSNRVSKLEQRPEAPASPGIDDILARLAKLEKDPPSSSLPLPLPPPLSAPSPPTDPIEKMGEIYATFCRDQREYLVPAFERAIQAEFPQAEVHMLYRHGGAQEIYFTDSSEGNPQQYWRASLGRDNYLFARPATPDRFGGVQGFQFPGASPPPPRRVRVCRPAVLIRGAQRWEVGQTGRLG